jgi:xanthine dehydrogenase small subunit
MSVRFLLNGENVRVDVVDPHVSLLEWLRGSGRTGSKEGCAEGECGACAVALLRRGLDGEARYDPVNSCLLSLPSMDGQNVWTVEGVAEPSGALHPVQKAMVDRGGSQCGYCTPGFVVSLFCEYYRAGRAEYDPEAISGNLCRCTGYRPIADVLRELPGASATDPRQPKRKLLLVESSGIEHVTGARRFLRPKSLEQVLELRARYPEAVLIAGGTDLMVYANQRYERWQTLISLEGVQELATIALTDAEYVLGAGVPLGELELFCKGRGEELGLLGQLFPLFSSRLIRHRATLGGNLGTASPIGDSPPALLALGAEVSLFGPAGARRLPLDEFFLGYRKTALRPDELILSVHVPRPAPRIQRFYKVSKRVMDDISTVAGAFALDLDSAGGIERLQVAFGGIAATPLRASALERLAQGRAWNTETLELLLGALHGLGTPISDHRGSAAYRAAMPEKLLAKFFAETASSAEAAE